MTQIFLKFVPFFPSHFRSSSTGPNISRFDHSSRRQSGFQLPPSNPSSTLRSECLWPSGCAFLLLEHPPRASRYQQENTQGSLGPSLPPSPVCPAALLLSGLPFFLSHTRSLANCPGICPALLYSFCHARLLLHIFCNVINLAHLPVLHSPWKLLVHLFLLGILSDSGADCHSSLLPKESVHNIS